MKWLTLEQINVKVMPPGKKASRQHQNRTSPDFFKICISWYGNKSNTNNSYPLKSWWALILKDLCLFKWSPQSYISESEELCLWLSLFGFALFCFCAWTLVKCWEIIVTSYTDCLIKQNNIVEYNG